MRHREQNANTPLVIKGLLHLENGQSSDIQIDSPEWFDFLDTRQPFYYAGQYGTLHARPEQRRDRWYWYAYRQKNGRLYKRYLGKTESLHQITLQRVAWRLNRD